MNIWLLKQNGTKVPNGDLIDEKALAWESTFIKEIISNASYNIPDNITFNGLADRRYTYFIL